MGYGYDGTLHRVGGPAETIYQADGKLDAEQWFHHGLRHRIDGPAVINHRSASTPHVFYVGGFPYKTPAEFADRLTSLGNERLRREFEISSYSELLDDGVEPGAVVDVVREGVLTVDGIREVLDGAPVEWVRSFEESRS